MQAAYPELKKVQGTVVNMSSMMAGTVKTSQMAYNTSKSMQDAVSCRQACKTPKGNFGGCVGCHLCWSPLQHCCVRQDLLLPAGDKAPRNAVRKGWRTCQFGEPRLCADRCVW